MLLNYLEYIPVDWALKMLNSQTNTSEEGKEASYLNVFGYKMINSNI